MEDDIRSVHTFTLTEFLHRSRSLNRCDSNWENNDEEIMKIVPCPRSRHSRLFPLLLHLNFAQCSCIFLLWFHYHSTKQFTGKIKIIYMKETAQNWYRCHTKFVPWKFRIIYIYLILVWFWVSSSCAWSRKADRSSDSVVSGSPGTTSATDLIASIIWGSGKHNSIR